MAAIKRRGDGYQVRWRTIGGQRLSRTCPNIRSAQALARAIEQAKALGEDWQPRHAASDPTVSDVAAAFLAERSRTLRQATLEQMTVALNRFLAYLGSVQPRGRIRMDIMRKSTLSGFHQSITADGCSASTANQYVRHIQGRKGLWAWAANDDRFCDITPRHRTIELAPAHVALTPVDISWAQCDMAIRWPAARLWYEQSMAVGRYTMLRRKQIFGLLWSDIDMAKALIRIRPELGKSRQEKRGRVIPASPHFIAEIAGWGTREGHLVKMPGSARTVNEAPLRRKWADSGAVPAAVRVQPFHLLRKAGMIELTRRGVPMDIIKALVGHNRGVSGDVYVQAASIMPLMRDAVAKITAIGDAGAVVALDEARGVR